MSTDSRRQQDNRVLWPDHNNIQTEGGGVTGTIVRIWAKTQTASIQISVIGIYFSGLICIGDSLNMNIIQHLDKNSLVFKLHGHYFVGVESLKVKVPMLRFLEMPRKLSFTGKPSYSKNSLAKMQRTLRALKQIHQCNQRIKSDIVSRGVDPDSPETGISITPTASQSSLAATASTASLSRLIFNKQLKQPSTKKKEIQLMTQIEELKLKLSMLKEEKTDLSNRIRETKSKIDYNLLETDNSTDNMTEKFHALAKDKEKLSNWLKTFDEFRNYKEKSTSDLEIRRRQLISQLSHIFPLHDTETSLPTIGYVCLPEADNLKERDETEICVALGWTSHLTLMVSNLLMVPTRYQINHAGSRSSMVDYILDKIPDKERTFPLYPKGVEKTRFEYAVYLLNKNIAQLRWHCNQETKDLRTTLRNLNGLLRALTTSEELAPSSSSMRMNLPVAPPVLSGLASSKAFTRGTPPGKVCLVHPESSEQSAATSSDSNETDSEASKQIALATASNGSCSNSNLENLVDPSPPGSMTPPSTIIRTVEPNVNLENIEVCCDSTSNNTTFNSKSVILSENISENLKPVEQNIKESETNTNEISVERGVEEKFDHTDQNNDEDSNNGFSMLRRKISVEIGEVADKDQESNNEKSEGTLTVVTPGVSGQQQQNQNKLDLLEPVESDNKKVEMGVAADMFWDSVSSRAQVLAVPNSFKTGNKKTFRQF